MSITLAGRLVLVGAGKMGGALLAGWLERGLDPALVGVQDPDPPQEMRAMLAAKGIALDAWVSESAEKPAVIVLAIKPQIMNDILPGIAGHMGANTLVLSIAAGRTIASIARHLPEGAALVRAMPNMPAAIGRGMTVAVAGAGVSTEQRAISTALLEAVGAVAWVEEEALMDPVTAVSGSGPAYVFLLAECLAKAGVSAGLTPDLAMRLARETVAGAGALMRASPLEPAILRRNVTSPGGTTEAALAVLMGEGGIGDLMRHAIAAATARSRGLSG